MKIKRRRRRNLVLDKRSLELQCDQREGGFRLDGMQLENLPISIKAFAIQYATVFVSATWQQPPSGVFMEIMVKHI